MSTSAPAHRVLGTVELLENILVNLSAYDLLYNAQLVSSSWKCCIVGSILLKRICFLESVEATEVSYMWTYHGGEY